MVKNQKPQANKSLSNMNRAELETLALAHKLDVSKYPNKATLIDALVKVNPKLKKPVAKKSNSQKFDHTRAYEFYIADHTRSYADVAKELGVAKRSIEAIARIEFDEIDLTNGKKTTSWRTWAEHRQLLGELAQKKVDDEYRKSVPVREEQHLLQYRNLQIAVSRKISAMAIDKIQDVDARQLSDAAKALKIAIDGERVIMGLSTSVSTIKPGENEKGQGWGELLIMAMDRVAQEEKADSK